MQIAGEHRSSWVTNRVGSVGKSKETVAADEVVGRVLDTVGPAPESSDLVAAEDLIHALGGEIADGVDLVVVLTAEDDPAGGGDVDVLEGTGAEIVAAAQPAVGSL